MATIFIEIGTFCVAIIIAVLFQIRYESKSSRDYKLFSRLLIAAIAIFVIDTLGWVIDGFPLFGQVWITTIIDGLDLISTTVVCWCWVQYALYIARGDKQTTVKWYLNPSNWLLILQIVLVSSSQIFGFYYSVDSSGVYHREAGYIVHTLISLAMLTYSSVSCLVAAHKEDKIKRKKDARFVSSIIIIPVLGNIFQFFVYGYPTVWLCMGFMIFIVYIHIQNKRTNLERELYEKELEKALDEAKHANNAKTQFLATMSHDMRTPMNGILGITALLNDKKVPAEIREDIDQIEMSAKYLLDLINDTLDMSKIEAGKMTLHNEPVIGKDLFNNVIETANILASQKGVTFKVDFPTDEEELWVPVCADASRVEQIFINLISNAVKFTPKGGTVTFRMESLLRTDEKLVDRFVVSDTGIGMSEEFQKHLFEPFSQEGKTNNNAQSGTGLGLAIVKQIVELMEGTISVESTENQGSTFTVELSYSRYKGEISSKEKSAIDLSVMKRKRVLLCEDHPVNAQIATRLLNKQGIEVEHAENGEIGTTMFRRSAEHYYDAILMDIRMPVMNGIEATKAIRSMTMRKDAKTVPIIAMTANAFDDDREQTKAAGMNAHLAKPVEPDKLYGVLAEFLAKDK